MSYCFPQRSFRFILEQSVRPMDLSWAKLRTHGGPHRQLTAAKHPQQRRSHFLRAADRHQISVQEFISRPFFQDLTLNNRGRIGWPQ